MGQFPPGGQTGHGAVFSIWVCSRKVWFLCHTKSQIKTMASIKKMMNKIKKIIVPAEKYPSSTS
jgi:hypothetical protein